MSNTTKNYGLIKPELTDTADITAMNPNWDKIDDELKNHTHTTEQLTGVFVIDVGTSGSWTYRKWSDGTYECWRKDTISKDITTAWGTGLYTSGDWLAGNFPVTFTDIPHCIYSISTHGYSVIGMSGASKPTTTTLPKIQFVRAHSTTGAPIEVNWYVKGNVEI